eukprot:4867880-Prymnesium_polylepis.1
MLFKAFVVGIAASASAQYCGETLVGIDASSVTNSDLSVEYTNAALVTETATAVPGGSGAFPSGSVRLKNIGTGTNHGDQKFDLLITIPTTPTSYSAEVSVAYVPPTGSS